MISLAELNERLIGRCGLYSQAEVDFLWWSAFEPGLHVEVGTLWGGSAVVAGLAKQALGRGLVVTVDSMRGGWWDTGDPEVGFAPSAGAVLDNLRVFGVQDWVQVIRAPSYPWPDGRREYSSVLIDGDHSYEGCLQDWVSVRDRARVVLFHDYKTGRHGGVDRVVDEVVRMDEGWGLIRQKGHLVGFAKR